MDDCKLFGFNARRKINLNMLKRFFEYLIAVTGFFFLMTIPVWACAAPGYCSQNKEHCELDGAAGTRSFTADAECVDASPPDGGCCMPSLDTNGNIVAPTVPGGEAALPADTCASENDCMTGNDCLQKHGTVKTTKECASKGLLCCIGAVAPTPTAAPVNPGSPTTLTDPLHLGANGIMELIRRLIQGVLGLVGGVAMLVFVVAGVTYMTSQDEKRISQAKAMMANAMIGIAIIMFSYVIANLFLKVITT